MATRKDWVPTQEEKLIELAAFWEVKLADTSLQNAYSWPADECAAAGDVLAAFPAARSAYRLVPTEANRIAKDEARAAAVDALRKFARERIRNNPKMSDPQKQELGVIVSDREPSPVPVPDAGPESDAVISAREPGVVKTRYLGAKPYGVDRIEIAWLVSDTPVDGPDQLTVRETFTRNPWSHTFGHDCRGRRLYYSMRYLTKGGASNWSDVREVVIP
jgi:hypothetical protein